MYKCLRTSNFKYSKSRFAKVSNSEKRKKHYETIKTVFPSHLVDMDFAEAGIEVFRNLLWGFRPY